jgi:hypothetical protein
MRDALISALRDALSAVGVPPPSEIHLEQPARKDHGDFSSNVAMVMAKAHAEREGIRFINPCLGLDLLAGQGTVALELLEQVPAMRTVLICTGGGGLLGPYAATVRARRG